MNERIKELAKQAFIYSCEFAHGPDYSPHNPYNELIEKERYDTKFAELIVWEAIGLCKVDVDALTGPFLSEYEKGIVEGYRRANKNLRFYFGVEE